MIEWDDALKVWHGLDSRTCCICLLLNYQEIKLQGLRTKDWHRYSFDFKCYLNSTILWLSWALDAFVFMAILWHYYCLDIIVNILILYIKTVLWPKSSLLKILISKEIKLFPWASKSSGKPKQFTYVSFG